MRKQFVLSEAEFEQLEIIKDILMSLYLDFDNEEEPSNYTKEYAIKAYNVLTNIIHGNFDENSTNLNKFELSK